MEKRDDFTADIKEVMKKRAAYICSNPSCKKMTIAPSLTDDMKVQYIGICAHITAAIKGGPRYDDTLTQEERTSIQNGIFLCSNCSIQIDKNKGIDFSISTLKQWKSDHEKWVLENLNKSTSSETPSLTITSTNQSGGIIANVVNVHGALTEKKDTINEHDKNIFQKADEILDEETLKCILGIILGDESIRAQDIDKIEELKHFYNKTSNQYINENIEDSKKQFLDALENFNEFLGTDFDMFPYNQRGENYRVCMNPKVNIDRGGAPTDENFQEHMRLKTLLRDKSNRLQDAYDILRRIIKLTLHI